MVFCETEPIRREFGFDCANGVRVRHRGLGSIVQKASTYRSFAGVGHGTPRSVRIAWTAFEEAGNFGDVIDFGRDILARIPVTTFRTRNR